MKFLNKIINPLLIIAIGAILRVVPHIPNFAPVTAMALFGGVYINKRYALIIPLITMILSDYLLLYVNPFSPNHFNFSHIYAPQAIWYGGTQVAVYGSFIISGCIGLWLRKHKSIKNIIVGSLIASLQFFLITNAAVWMTGMYDRGVLGLWESYIAGIPFFRWTILGDLFYTGIFLGGFEFVTRIFQEKKVAHA